MNSINSLKIHPIVYAIGLALFSVSRVSFAQETVMSSAFRSDTITHPRPINEFVFFHPLIPQTLASVQEKPVVGKDVLQQENKETDTKEDAKGSSAPIPHSEEKKQQSSSETTDSLPLVEKAADTDATSEKSTSEKNKNDLENVPFIWVDLCVTENAVCASDISARKKDGVWQADLNDNDFERLMLNKEKFTQIVDDEGSWIVLQTADYDEGSLKLTWSAGLENLTSQTSAEQQNPEQVVQGTYPLALALDYTASTSGDNVSFFTNAVVGKKNWAYSTTASWDNANHKFVQGLSVLEYNQVNKGLLWSFGDVATRSSDGLGSGGLIKGFGVARAFEQDPTLIKTVRHEISGIADRPGRIEVYSNNILISSQEVRPGPFVIRDLNISQGRQNVQLVLRDEAGNKINLNNEVFYNGMSLLAPGLYDYGFYAGRLKATQYLDTGIVDPLTGETNVPNVFDAVDEQHRPPRQSVNKQMNVAQGYWKTGLNDRWTIGVRAEYAKEVQNYGVAVATITPIGELSVSAGKSSLGGKALSSTYSYSTRYSSFMWSHYQQDRNYKSPSNFYQTNTDNLIRSSNNYSLSTGIIPNLSVGIQYGDIDYFDRFDQKIMSASLSGRLFKDAQWSLMFRQTTEDITKKKDKSISFMMSIPLGKNNHGSVSVDNSNNGTSYNATVSSSSSENIGFGGYSVSSTRNANGEMVYEGSSTYKTNYGNLVGNFNQNAGQTTYNLGLNGSVVITTKELLFGPPLGSAFAIIDAPNAPKVPIMNGNSAAGKTNRSGKAIVSGLSPFYPSKVGFNQDLLDIDVDVGNEMTKTILPTFKTPTKVYFKASQAKAVEVQLTWPNGVPVKYGSAEFKEPYNRTVNLGKAGMLWLDDIEEGTYIAWVNHEKGTAKCTIVIEKIEVGVNDLGTVTCELLTGAGEVPEEVELAARAEKARQVEEQRAKAEAERDKNKMLNQIEDKKDKP